MEPPVLFTLAAGIVISPVLVLLHELGHALAAAPLTGERVRICIGEEPRRLRFEVGPIDFAVGFPWGSGGLCEYDPDRLPTSRHEALIAAAGPLASLLSFGALLPLAVAGAAWPEPFATVTLAAALGSAGGFIGSAVPMRYPPLYAPSGVSDSDGLAVWRILTGRATLLPGREPTDPSDLPLARPLFLAALAAIVILAIAIDPWLGLWILLLFGFAALLQGRPKRNPPPERRDRTFKSWPGS